MPVCPLGCMTPLSPGSPPLAGGLWVSLLCLPQRFWCSPPLDLSACSRNTTGPSKETCLQSDYSVPYPFFPPALFPPLLFPVLLAPPSTQGQSQKPGQKLSGSLPLPHPQCQSDDQILKMLANSAFPLCVHPPSPSPVSELLLPGLLCFLSCLCPDCPLCLPRSILHPFSRMT